MYLHVKYPFCPIVMRLNFSRHIFESIQIYFMKIRPVGAEFFHAGGRKDRRTEGHRAMKKLIVAFRNFANDL